MCYVIILVLRIFFNAFLSIVLYLVDDTNFGNHIHDWPYSCILIRHFLLHGTRSSQWSTMYKLTT